MRQTLMRIWLEKPWAGWTEIPGEPPRLGACWIVIGIAVAYFLFHLVRGKREAIRDRSTWGLFIGVLIVLSVQPFLGILPETGPVFGYGMLVLIGFTTAMWFSCVRASAVGFESETILDAAFWVLLLGILGGRIAFLVQHGGPIFARANGPFDVLFQAVNLTQGGLVQIGGLLGGTLGFLLFCYVRKVNFFEFADIMAPAIFIGIGFGRIGCLLNGCCFGDACDLPWAIQFPRESAAFGVLDARGFIKPGEDFTFPMHPTQIYSSINGFVLAFVTAVFYWYRRFPGDVFALAAILYAITRTQLEFLRADELGQLGTMFTISQFYSVGILMFGVAVMLTGPMRSKTESSKILQAT